MSLVNSALSRRAFSAVLAVAFASYGVVAAAVPADASDGTLVPLRSILRACDFHPIPGGAPQNNATASAVIHASGGTAAADVHISEPSAPGAHFDVALIQAPRASTLPCTAPGPSVAIVGVDTDGVGQASTTVRDGIRSGTTGVWVFIQRPDPYSQTPAEFYTSDFVAPV